MPYDSVRFLLFPHMTLSEGHFRSLSLLIPQLSLLRILREPTLPRWSRDRVVGCPSGLGEARLDQIRHSLKNFQDFSALHEERTLMASLSHKTLFRETSESRFAIQDMLREKGADAPGAEDRLVLEAALFLEMALDLDEKEKDLESDLAQAEGLESEFRDILGIASGEELDEDLEPMSTPLLPDRGHLSFKLGQRMASWLRLYPGCHDTKGQPVFVSVIADVLDELIDCLLAHRERSARSIQVEAAALGSLPNLSRLPADLWKNANGKIQEDGLLTELWSLLHEVVLDPRDANRLKACREEIAVVDGLLRDLCPEGVLRKGDDIKLTLTCLQDVPFAELWQCLDKDGYAAMKDAFPIPEFSCVFLGVY
ncbi:MAG: hypothetical protein AB9873_20365 [Syntrophobacteraceae bacterium]